MKTLHVIAHYGTQIAVADALGVSQASISKWGEFPPDNRQLQIERITLGALKAEPGCMDRVLGFKEKAAL